MKINSFNNKGLKKLYEAKEPRNVKGLNPDHVGKLHNQLSAIDTATNVQELLDLGLWKFHNLAPDRPSTWSMWVTGNWRLTFYLNDDGSIKDVDLEDYHRE